MTTARTTQRQIPFEEILQVVAYGILIQDAKGHVVYANKACAKMLGFTSPKALRESTSQKLYMNRTFFDEHEKRIPRRSLPDTRAFQGTIPESLTVSYTTGTKRATRWAIIEARPIVDTSGNVVFVVSLFQDITAAKEIEHKLRKSLHASKQLEEEHLFQRLLLEAENEATPDGRLIVSPEGRTISFNKKYLDLWGIAESQLAHKTEAQRLKLYKTRVTNQKDLLENTHRINANPKRVYNDEVELLNGRFLHRYTTPLKHAGVHYGRVWFVRDITELKKEVRRQEQFLAIASHELKTPLASIMAYIHLLGQTLSEQKNTAPFVYIEKINEQTNKLHKLIKDLLDLTMVRTNRLELHKEPIVFDDFIKEVVSDMRPTTRHTIRLTGSTHATITADRHRLAEVFSNLIRNAIKYSPHAKRVLVKLSARDKNVIVEVKDQGIGIRADKVDQIFELFSRVSGSKGISGFGVGLYISHEIVRKHNGQINVDSTLGKGSTFQVILPLS